VTQDALAAALRRARFPVALTGAGISVASGLPTFRGGDGLWDRDITELATRSFFASDPHASWQWYLERFGQLHRAEPNSAHYALAALDLLVVTQNIDLLHERAGTHDLIKVHGSADRMRCSRDGCADGSPNGSVPLDTLRFTTVPACARCAAPMRPHILWFDEYYQEHDDYQFVRVLDILQRTDFVLFVGTSFSVGIAQMFLQAVRQRRVPAFSIDPAGNPLAGIATIAEPAEKVLPELVSRRSCG
jgi:NAD-dependent deacetylase